MADFKSFSIELKQVYTKYVEILKPILNNYIDAYKELLIKVAKHPSISALYKKQHNYDVNVYLRDYYGFNEETANKSIDKNFVCRKVLMQVVNQYLGKYLERYCELDENLEDCIISDLIEDFQRLEKMSNEISKYLDDFDSSENKHSIDLYDFENGKVLFLVNEARYRELRLTLVDLINQCTDQNLLDNEYDMPVFAAEFSFVNDLTY